MPRVAHEQKEKWKRRRKKNDGLHSPDPFVNPADPVTKGRQKRQDRKLRADISRLIPRPINLRISEMKTVRIKISRDRGNIALSPAPVVDERLINRDQTNGDGDDRDRNQHKFMSIFRRGHGSPLDKRPRQSQSSKRANSSGVVIL